MAMAIREDERERRENRCDGGRGEGANARRCGHERSMSCGGWGRQGRGDGGAESWQLGLVRCGGTVYGVNGCGRVQKGMKTMVGPARQR